MPLSNNVRLKKCWSWSASGQLIPLVIVILLLGDGSLAQVISCASGEWDCLENEYINKRTCIPQRLLCNTVPDCPKGSDEGGLCGNCLNYGCQRICLDTPTGPICRCNPGETVGSDSKSCEDVNECEMGTDKCGHFCTNTIGSYTCSCYFGYHLASDGHRCQLNDSESARLLIGVNEYVIKIPLTGINLTVKQSKSAMETKLPIGSRIQDLDYSATDDQIFMIVSGTTPSYRNVIYSVFNKKAQCLVDNIFSASAIAVDWTTNNIYYATDGSSRRCGIGACTKDGRYCRTLLRNDKYDMYRFRGLVLHPRRGLMFFLVLDRNGHSRIDQASMNGGRHAIKVRDIEEATIQAIAIDNILERLYYFYVYGESKIIAHMNIVNGKAELGDVTFLPMEHAVNGMSFDFLLHNGNIFWTDWWRLTLMVAPIDDRTQRRVMLNYTTVKQHYSVGGIAISHSMYHQKEEPDPCQSAACSHMCVLNYTSFEDSPSAVCTCPDHYTMDGTGHCLPFTDDEHGELELEMAPEICTSLLLKYCRNGTACFNGGECVTVRSIGGRPSSVTCKCPAGFFGLYCEVNLSSTSNFSVAILITGSLVLLVLFLFGIIYFAMRSGRLSLPSFLRSSGENKDIAIRFSTSSATAAKSDDFANPICEEDVSSVSTCT